MYGTNPAGSGSFLAIFVAIEKNDFYPFLYYQQKLKNLF